MRSVDEVAAALEQERVVADALQQAGVISTAAPEFSKEIYDGITEKLFGHAPMREDDAPEGLIVHSAGKGDQGYYVYDIWESREAFQRFMDEKLGPAMGEVMGGPPPESGGPQFFPVDVLVVRR